jgi:hypothetical protein
MKTTTSLFLTFWLACAATAAETALTIYNQNFAVVREAIPLDLKAGVNQVRFAGATTYLEPSSVILRDPAGKRRLQILEQNFRGDPVSQELLLDLNEGKTIEFERVTTEGGQVKRELIPGKIIRSGYLGYGSGAFQPIIEVNGKLLFSLPGQPIFPALADNTILKPTLLWQIETDEAAKFDAELSYVTGEMRWEADYNLVLPERGDTLDVVGWITMDNESGKSFEQARIKLMAGDVNKIQPSERYRRLSFANRGGGGGGGGAPPVTEKSFDEYHLYTLERPTTLLDREKKQVEFVRGAGVKSVPIYIYDGASATPEDVWNYDTVHAEPEYGTKCNKNIWVMREFTNSAANHLGLPLPKGRVRVYRRNSDGQMEFTGENVIKHTPRDEVIRLVMGNAFDLMGERKRTAYKDKMNPNTGLVAIDPSTGLPVPAKVPPNDEDPGPWIDESFEIKLRNHKKESVEIRAVEHLYRWMNWRITAKSDDYLKTDSKTMEFRVRLKPDEEKIVTYKVRYWW